MFAEIIERPIAGQFIEQHFGETSTNSLWVKFIDNNYEEWVGSFANGWNGYPTEIINFEDRDKPKIFIRI